LQWLIQYPRHSVDNELEVLRSMQSAKKMTIVVLLLGGTILFRDRI
jgi:hypothetical protein